MPNFDPYASSYNHIFIQNTSKLHFLYPARLVGYDYVEEIAEKILRHFLEGKITHFFGIGAPTPKKCVFSPLKNVGGFFQHFLPHTHIQLV